MLRWLKIQSSSDDSKKDTSDTDCDPELLYADSTTRMESFSEKWVKSFDQENRISLGLFLPFQFC